MTPEIVADYACRTGERPLWHAAERRLYWTDIPAGKMFRYDPATGRHEQVYEGRPVGGFTIQADGALLLFMDRGTVATWRDGELRHTIIDDIAAEHDSRFNDVIADPAGRVFCGTMGVKDDQGRVVRNGRLYRLDCDGKITRLLDDVATSNGMGFTLDLRTMYHTETGRRTIWQFDYDQATGAITNRRAFITLPQQPTNARPDGLAVDAEGRLWSAQYDGGCLICFDAQGREQQRLELPTSRVTCPTFGGEALDELYVATAGGDDRQKNGPTAGALFRFRLAARGRPEFLSRVGL
ncbi:MAG TPA: SMP-30/gluconolactonase/LRE family protein [Pirellulales bacterium]|jgi:D-xylonolactonase|nr:SMP-30/gluconolactonase/LRE family protein [Pirellulales bacterium]